MVQTISLQHHKEWVGITLVLSSWHHKEWVEITLVLAFSLSGFQFPKCDKFNRFPRIYLDPYEMHKSWQKSLHFLECCSLEMSDYRLKLCVEHWNIRCCSGAASHEGKIPPNPVHFCASLSPGNHFQQSENIQLSTGQWYLCDKVLPPCVC